MLRSIAGYHQDEVGDWVAELSCLHRQHVRHRPPFQERSWVLDSSERDSRLGSPIDCPLCDRFELPEGLSLQKTLGPFDRDTLPHGLRLSHRIAEATWGVLRVTAGEVEFHIETTPPLELYLASGSSQAIPPQVPHRLVTPEPVELVVELWAGR